MHVHGAIISTMVWSRLAGLVWYGRDTYDTDKYKDIGVPFPLFSFPFFLFRFFAYFLSV